MNYIFNTKNTAIVDKTICLRMMFWVTVFSDTPPESFFKEKYLARDKTML